MDGKRSQRQRAAGRKGPFARGDEGRLARLGCDHHHCAEIARRHRAWSGIRRHFPGDADPRAGGRQPEQDLPADRGFRLGALQDREEEHAAFRRPDALPRGSRQGHDVHGHGRRGRRQGRGNGRRRRSFYPGWRRVGSRDAGFERLGRQERPLHADDRGEGHENPPLDQGAGRRHRHDDTSDGASVRRSLAGRCSDRAGGPHHRGHPRRGGFARRCDGRHDRRTIGGRVCPGGVQRPRQGGEQGPSEHAGQGR